MNKIEDRSISEVNIDYNGCCMWNFDSDGYWITGGTDFMRIRKHDYLAFDCIFMFCSIFSLEQLNLWCVFLSYGSIWICAGCFSQLRREVPVFRAIRVSETRSWKHDFWDLNSDSGFHLLLNFLVNLMQALT